MNEVQNTACEKTLIRQWVAAALGGEAWARIDCRGQSWGLLQFGRAITGAPLCLHGRTHERGLGTHAHSEIAVRLPRPGGTITWAEAKLRTPQGEAAIRWDLKDGGLDIHLTVPEGSRATLSLPEGWIASPATFAPGVHTVRAAVRNPQREP